MHTNKSLQTINYLQIIVAVILAAMSFIILPVCGPMKNGMHMSCYYTGILETVVGIVLFVLAIVNLTNKNALVHKILPFAQIVIAAIAYMIPTKIIPIAVGTTMNGKTKLIGLCMKPMRCWTSFRGCSICLLIVVLLALIYLGMQYVTKKD